MIRALMLALMLPLPALAWPWSAPAPAAPVPPRPVASMIVDDSPIQTHSLPGAIRASTEVALAFQTLGRMTNRQVDVGDVVHKGQLLATLDPEDLQAEVRAAAASPLVSLYAVAGTHTIPASAVEAVRQAVRRALTELGG
jgi:multidrug efflux pump subunit AcrA (membrane-fusion protein)